MEGEWWVVDVVGSVRHSLYIAWEIPQPYRLSLYMFIFVHNFLWVLYFQQVRELPDYFQNQLGRTTFRILTMNLKI